MQQYHGNAQIINLHSLEQGQNMLIIITGANTAFTLEFQHGTDLTWYPHPQFINVAAAASNILELRCVSGKMRVNFAATPSAYELTTVWAAENSF